MMYYAGLFIGNIAAAALSIGLNLNFAATLGLCLTLGFSLGIFFDIAYGDR